MFKPLRKGFEKDAIGVCLHSETIIRYEGKPMYAVFETGGKQYKAAEGDVLFIEKLNAQAGQTVTFDKVLLVGDENGITAGTPYVAGAAVEAQLEKNGKGKKIRIFKFKAKKTYRKRQGHRQPYSKVIITAVKAWGRRDIEMAHKKA